MTKLPEGDEELKLYYSGLGKLASVFYALGSNDMHSHNVIPASGGPVGESMILPRFYGKGQTSPLFLPCRYAPEDFGPIFIHSFPEGYRKICAMKEQIIEILNCYKDTTLRYLLRSTQSYIINAWRYKIAKNDEERQKVIRRLEKGLSEADILRLGPVL